MTGKKISSAGWAGIWLGVVIMIIAAMLLLSVGDEQASGILLVVGIGVSGLSAAFLREDDTKIIR